jgi:hypothetical protein
MTQAALSIGSESASELDWMTAHEALSRLAKTRAGLDWEEGQCLLTAMRTGAHRHLGFGSFSEYVDVSFGYKPHSVEEKLRVAEALEGLPELSQSLKEGALSWSAVRELTRVAVPQTEHEWLDAARGLRMRDVERLVSCRKPGDRPTDQADPNRARHRLSFEVSAETFALFREAIGKLRRDTPGPLDEETALLLMARQVLRGPSDAGRASYQIALHVCEQCRRGFQEARGELVEVGSEIVEMACCDAQHIGRVDASSDPAGSHVGAQDSGPTDTPTKAARSSRRSRQCDVKAPKRKRAVQKIPPAVRREVRLRDRGCCVVPGCRNASFLDQHHLHPRSEGGDHDPDKIITLCGAHHRAHHLGKLVIVGTSVSSGLTFRHADGSTYGQPVSAQSASAFTKVFLALRSMGFRETEARRALERVRAEPGMDGAELKEIVRRALQLLGESRNQRSQAGAVRRSGEVASP